MVSQINETRKNEKIDFVKLNKVQEKKILNKENNFLKLFIKGVMKKVIKSEDEEMKEEKISKIKFWLFKKVLFSNIGNSHYKDTDKSLLGDNLPSLNDNNKSEIESLNDKSISYNLKSRKKNSDINYSSSQKLHETNNKKSSEKNSNYGVTKSAEKKNSNTILILWSKNE